jgi:hypothetical protein
MFPGVWEFTSDARLLRVGILKGEVAVERVGLQDPVFTCGAASPIKQMAGCRITPKMAQDIHVFWNTRTQLLRISKISQDSNFICTPLSK